MIYNQQYQVANDYLTAHVTKRNVMNRESLRVKRMNSTAIQPICNKEEVLKRYRTVFKCLKQTIC